MPELYVDGQWAAARAGGAPRDPLPGRRHAWSPRSTRPGPRTPRPPSPPRTAPSTTGPWPRTSGPRARRPAAARRRPARARHGRRSPGSSRSTPASGWSRASTTSTTSSRVFRHYGRVAAEDAGRDGRHRQPRRGQPDRARAGRRLRPDHAVELPAAPGVVEGRALPGRRQHVRAQAQRAHPAHRDPPDAAARGGRPARRRRQPRRSAPGPSAGAPLSTDPRVDLVSFTGGLATGRRDHGRGRRRP